MIRKEIAKPYLYLHSSSHQYLLYYKERLREKMRHPQENSAQKEVSKINRSHYFLRGSHLSNCDDYTEYYARKK